MSGRSLRVGIIGVGNCASSLVQGLTYYRDASPTEDVPGLMSVELGGYHIRDIVISAAFDVNAAKVGRDLSDAILAPPNNTMRFAEVDNMGVTVHRGRTLDGIGQFLRDRIEEHPGPEADIPDVLIRSGTEILVSYLPVGSQQATEWYAEQALRAGCAFVNCVPVFIASDPGWRRRFEERRLPIIGDDIKSQVGATIVHRALVQLYRDRGVRVDRTYQLNFGGNADFLNMLERERLESKKISKTRAVTSQLDHTFAADDVHIGPSDHVPWLTDRKCALIRLEGTGFGGLPIHAELKLEVWDSPNSAGVVIDAVRCAKLALDRRIGGALAAPSSYFMKSPPEQICDHEARLRLRDFVADGQPR